MNVFLHFYDTVTWPENLTVYLSNDPVANAAPLRVLQSTEYPFTSLENRVTVLQHLTNSVLSTAAVRDDLVNEGSLPMEDHCRVCHKLGDMVGLADLNVILLTCMFVGPVRALQRSLPRQLPGAAAARHPGGGLDLPRLRQALILLCYNLI